jgi:hypothetical protein
MPNVSASQLHNLERYIHEGFGSTSKKVRSPVSLKPQKFKSHNILVSNLIFLSSSWLLCDVHFPPFLLFLSFCHPSIGDLASIVFSGIYQWPDVIGSCFRHSSFSAGSNALGFKREQETSQLDQSVLYFMKHWSIS